MEYLFYFRKMQEKSTNWSISTFQELKNQPHVKNLIVQKRGLLHHRDLPSFKVLIIMWAGLSTN